MRAAALNNPPSVIAERRIGLIVIAITLLHLISAVVLKYGLPSFAPNKSEITIELGASQPRGEGGTGARAAPAPVPANPQPKKSAERDELATKRPVDTPKPAATAAAPSTSSASAGADTAPTIDADYKAAYLNNPKPPYPPVAFQMRIEGTVTVKALVQADGSCGEVLLGRSSGNALLDQSALKTVADWKFVPAKAQGKDIAQWVSIPITFALKRR